MEFGVELWNLSKIYLVHQILGGSKIPDLLLVHPQIQRCGYQFGSPMGRLPKKSGSCSNVHAPLIAGIVNVQMLACFVLSFASVNVQTNMHLGHQNWNLCLFILFYCILSHGLPLKLQMFSLITIQNDFTIYQRHFSNHAPPTYI